MKSKSLLKIDKYERMNFVAISKYSLKAEYYKNNRQKR